MKEPSYMDDAKAVDECAAAMNKKAAVHFLHNLFYAVFVQRPPSRREWIAGSATRPAIFCEEEHAERYADRIKAKGAVGVRVGPIYTEPFEDLG